MILPAPSAVRRSRLRRHFCRVLFNNRDGISSIRKTATRPSGVECHVSRGCTRGIVHPAGGRELERNTQRETPELLNSRFDLRNVRSRTKIPPKAPSPFGPPLFPIRNSSGSKRRRRTFTRPEIYPMVLVRSSPIIYPVCTE